MTHTPVTILNSHPTMNLYRFHTFANQKSHNTSLLLFSALLQGHWHLIELFPRFLWVPTPSIGSSRSPPSHIVHTMKSVVHAIFDTTFLVSHWMALVFTEQTGSNDNMSDMYVEVPSLNLGQYIDCTARFPLVPWSKFWDSTLNLGVTTAIPIHFTVSTNHSATCNLNNWQCH